MSRLICSKKNQPKFQYRLFFRVISKSHRCGYQFDLDVWWSCKKPIRTTVLKVGKIQDQESAFSWSILSIKVLSGSSLKSTLFARSDWCGSWGKLWGIDRDYWFVIKIGCRPYMELKRLNLVWKNDFSRLKEAWLRISSSFLTETQLGIQEFILTTLG